MNKIAGIYKRDEAVISKFLDNTSDLPKAVVEALCLRLGDLRKFIKMLDETEVQECAAVAGRGDPDVEMSNVQ